MQFIPDFTQNTPDFTQTIVYSYIFDKIKLSVDTGGKGANDMKQFIIKVSYETNKSYPHYKEVLRDLVITMEDANNEYRIEDRIKQQHGLEADEYILQLEWDEAGAVELDKEVI